MFDDISGKIKGLAIASTIIGIVASIIGGLVLLFAYSSWTGLLLMLCGSLSSWISSFAFYGFGELLERVEKIEENTRGLKQSSPLSSGTMPSSSPAVVSNSHLSLREIHYRETGEGGWRCKKCDVLNKESRHTCQSCGVPRSD